MKFLKVFALSTLMIGLVACGGTNTSNNSNSVNDKDNSIVDNIPQTDWKDDEKETMIEVLGRTLPFIQMADGYMVEVEVDEETDEQSIVIYDESELFTVEGYGKILEDAGFIYDEETSALIQLFLGLDMYCYEIALDETYTLTVAYYHFVPEEGEEGFEANYIEAYVYDSTSELDKEGDGTLESPFTVSQCLDIIATYEPKGSSDTPVYIIGSVKEVKKQGTSGDLQIVLEDSTSEILCYYVKMNKDSTSENNWESKDVLEEGDILVIYGTLKAYEEKDKSITPEVNSGAYCVSINGYTPDEYFYTGVDTYDSWNDVKKSITEFLNNSEHKNEVIIPELIADEYYVQLTLDDEEYYDSVLIECDGVNDKYLDKLKEAGYYVPINMGEYGYECIDPNKEIVLIYGEYLDPESDEAFSEIYILNYNEYYFGDYSFNKCDSWLDVDAAISGFLAKKEIIDTVPEITANEYYVKINYDDQIGYLDCVQIDVKGDSSNKIINSLKLEHYTVPLTPTEYGYECISSTKTIEIDVLYDESSDVTTICIYSYADVLEM